MTKDESVRNSTKGHCGCSPETASPRFAGRSPVRRSGKPGALPKHDLRRENIYQEFSPVQRV